MNQHTKPAASAAADIDRDLAKAKGASLFWACASGAISVLAVAVFFAGYPPVSVGMTVAAVACIWRYLGAADRVQHLEHQVEARNGTGAGQFWAGK